MTTIRKWNYGNYSGGNYGAHSLAIQIGNLTLYFSYNTVIAFRTPETGLVVSVNQWGPTTGKHLNRIMDNKNFRIPRAEFEAKLQNMLKSRNLDVEGDC